MHDIVSGRKFSEESVATIVAPFVLAFFFFFGTMAAGGYMLSVVADEKENRTLEIMVTSRDADPVDRREDRGPARSPPCFSSLSTSPLTRAAGGAGRPLHPGSCPTFRCRGPTWAPMTLYFLPSYALLSGVMVAIGSAVTGLEQGQQIAGMLNLVFGLPLYVMPVLFENPGHPLLVVLTLFPPTAFMSIALRWGLGTRARVATGVELGAAGGTAAA